MKKSAEQHLIDLSRLVQPGVDTIPTAVVRDYLERAVPGLFATAEEAARDLAALREHDDWFNDYVHELGAIVQPGWRQRAACATRRRNEHGLGNCPV
jgi:hypothetical protein